MLILAVDTISPHASVPREDRLTRVLMFLEAQFGDAILVGVLHLGLASDEAGQHIIAERKIDRR